MKKEITSFLKVYLFTWLSTFLLYFSSIFKASVTFDRLWDNYTSIITNITGFIAFHILALIFYLLFLIFRYYIRVYKKKGIGVFFKQLFFRLFTPILLIVIIIKSLLYINNNEDFNYQWNHIIENKTDTIQDLYKIDGKHRGMGVYDFGRSNRTTKKELIKNNIEWVQILPYFYQETETSKEIKSIKKLGVWSRRDSSFIKSIQDLHAQKIKVHLKPHLWMGSGWRSNINFDHEKDWDNWFESYRKTILHYALMAEKTKAELFCIGTELRSSVKHQPEKWKKLIQEIKTIYAGKLTYAANWDDNFDTIDFWNELDYIGIQGYFPLTKESSPTLESIQKGWQNHKEMLQMLSEKHEKKILFTEVGYRPDVNATKAPWEWGSIFGSLFKKKSNKTQYLAYEAMYGELWKEPWFAGTYIWQWNNSDFEIKGKPAENSIAKWYATLKK